MISVGTVNVGAVVSITLMVCTKVVILSQASVNDQVRVIVDSLSQEPSATLSEKEASRSGSQLSASLVTSPVMERSVASISHSIVISAGTVNVGDVVSTTVIVCESEIELPQLSTAVHVLMMIFVFPHVSVISSDSEIVRPPQSSSALAKPVFSLDSSSPHSMVTSTGIVIIGGVVSSTTIV